MAGLELHTNFQLKRMKLSKNGINQTIIFQFNSNLNKTKIRNNLYIYLDTVLLMNHGALKLQVNYAFESLLALVVVVLKTRVFSAERISGLYLSQIIRYTYFTKCSLAFMFLNTIIENHSKPSQAPLI